MNHALRAAAFAILVSLCASCQSKRLPVDDVKSPAAKVTHVVLMWLKTPGDEGARRKIVEASRTFTSIPGVVSVSSGAALPSTRPVVDSSYDVALVITFADEAALRAYDQHPTHKKAVDEIIKPLVGKLLVYDFR
jgi:hypothetical protein